MNFRENPFASRNVVKTVSDFRGRSEILNFIIYRLSDNINLFGEPRIGRSSLLSFLVNERGARLLPGFGDILKQYRFISLDLQIIDRNETDFWRAIVDELHGSLKSPSSHQFSEESTFESGFAVSKRSASTYELVKTFESLIKASPEQVVVVFDNFDFITKFRPEEALQITDKLRAISQKLNRRISYLVGSIDSINILFEEKELIQPMSPFPSIFEYQVPLGLLEMTAVKEIISGAANESNIDPGTSDYGFQWLKANEDLIINLAGRHPDLVKRVCFYFYDAFLLEDTDVEKIMERVNTAEHVRFLFDSIVSRQKETKANKPYLEILKQVAEGAKLFSNNLLNEFSDLGLMETENEQPKIFSELFREYLLNNVQWANEDVQTQNPHFVGNNIKEVSLTPREQRLYDYLNDNIGELCSRQSLKNAIWGTALPGGDADLALEQLIKRLRFKIEVDDKNPQKLLTIRGKGYLLKR